MCTGCGACVVVCPKEAVSLSDTLKNLNAIIDEDKCINCGACERVCQQINPMILEKPISWFQGWSTDSKSRAMSSSGGFAYHIMEQFLKEGGMVCSCVFDNGEFIYKVVYNKEELNIFRGSKYIKSYPGTAYTTVKKLIKSGNKVLFVGLPCHVAAIRKFIGDDNNDNLYTVDLICHGSPSKGVLTKFLKEKGFSIDSLSDVIFRQKNRFRISVKDINNRKESFITPPGVRDRYTVGFLNGLFYTDNCYHCKYARLERVSDITIGDSWGSDLEGTEEGKLGISLALCQTKRGEELLKNSNVYLLKVDLEKAVWANHQLYEASRIPQQRELFFAMIEKGSSVNHAVAKCYPKTCRRQIIKAILTRLHVINMRRFEPFVNFTRKNKGSSLKN